MPAPKGHPLWGNPLKPKKYTPEQLWKGACEYFRWVDENPWKIVEQKKAVTRITNAMAETLPSDEIEKLTNPIAEIPKQRPYTIEAMCRYLNISPDTFENYSKAVGYETYFGTCRAIKEIINSQHLEGGMVGAFNSNIVTRKLGLAERYSGDINLNMPKVEVNDKETAESVKKLFK